MATFRAKVVEDIPANRLIGLGGVSRDPEEGWDIPLLIHSRLGWVPDFVTSKELKAGEYVTVSIKDRPIWEVEAAEDLPAGTAVQCTEDGRVKHYRPEDGNHIGCTIHAVKAGETVKFFRKYGTMPQSQAETLTMEVTKSKTKKKKTSK